MSADDRVAATLAGAKRIEGFRRRHHHGHTSNPRRDYCSADNQDWPCDVASLLAAVEAALKLADDLEAPSIRNPPTKSQIATAFREAITAALAGKETGDAQMG